ncbi:MAG TPA: YigZ family protein [Candidatus Cloacimonadota bacterium]|nr:YigZ family protein [Candidatus Cloacimonadota bacterium]
MKIIKDLIIYEEKIQKSTFIAQLCPVNTWQEAKDFITQINQEHQNATHNCWAYIVGNKGEISHSSDDGEPSGTAGKPMLNVLNKYQMTNIVAVVTRYFGGIKLGVRGLIDAYGGVCDRAIEQSQTEELVFKKCISITTDYDFYNILKHRIAIPELRILNTEYTDKVVLIIEIHEEKLNFLFPILNEMQIRKKLDYQII